MECACGKRTLYKYKEEPLCIKCLKQRLLELFAVEESITIDALKEYKFSNIYEKDLKEIFSNDYSDEDIEELNNRIAYLEEELDDVKEENFYLEQQIAELEEKTED